MKMLVSGGTGIWEFYDYILCFAKLVIIFGTLLRVSLDLTLNNTFYDSLLLQKTKKQKGSVVTLILWIFELNIMFKHTVSVSIKLTYQTHWENWVESGPCGRPTENPVSLCHRLPLQRDHINYWHYASPSIIYEHKCNKYNAKFKIFFTHRQIQTWFKLHGGHAEVFAQQTVGELVVEGGGVHHTNL